MFYIVRKDPINKKPNLVQKIILRQPGDMTRNKISKPLVSLDLPKYLGLTK